MTPTASLLGPGSEWRICGGKECRAFGWFDDQMLGILRLQILDTDKAALREDLQHAPAWIADLLRPFVGGEVIGPSG